MTRRKGAIHLMANILLAVLLFSLATQVPDFGAQVTRDHAMTGLSQSAAVGHGFSIDFDDDQRGAKTFALAFLNLLIPCGTRENSLHSGDTPVDFCFAGLPLFKLHAALLI
jgi:hypothetical protein